MSKLSNIETVTKHTPLLVEVGDDKVGVDEVKFNTKRAIKQLFGKLDRLLLFQCEWVAKVRSISFQTFNITPICLKIQSGV